MMKSLAAAALASAMFLTPAAAQDGSGAVTVNRLLDSVSDEIGLTEVSSRIGGRLAARGTQTGRFQVSAGRALFVGVCDGGCSDVDLIVRDSSGRELGRDFETDDAPMVLVEDAAAGRYSVEVIMVECTSQCEWGVGVFR